MMARSSYITMVMQGLFFTTTLCLPADGDLVFSEDFSQVTSTDTPHLGDSEKWGANTQYLFDISDVRWTFTGTSVLVIHPSGGDQAVALNESPEHGVATTTPIAGFIAGQSYQLTFDHWGDDRPNTTPYEVDIKLDGNPIGHISRTYPAFPSAGASATVFFTATASSHQLSFHDVTFAGQASAILDNISIVSAVPETPPLPLLLAALAVFGLYKGGARMRTILGATFGT
jgi:hypothetical protein